MAVVLKNGKIWPIRQPRSNQLIDFSDTHHQKSSSFGIAIIANAPRRIYKLFKTGLNHFKFQKMTILYKLLSFLL